MIRKPFFSIIIPTYNRAKDLQFALFCITRQTFTDYEIVISDNGSTDDTQDMVKKLKNKKIRYYRNIENIGLIPNQSLVITYARGRYVFLHGDDDFLLYKESLREIYTEVIKYSAGFIRINYASLAFDKKHVFSYKVNKLFQENYYLPPHESSERILSFIINSDNYFFSGIVFKNQFPKNITMIDADPSPWINILFYLTRKHGGYFIARRHILAYWSRRTNKKEDHGFYMPIGVRLKAEAYFEAVKGNVSHRVYRAFLRKELMTIYVNLLPAIKINVGNRIFRQVIGRMRFLDTTLSNDFWFRVKCAVCFILPVEVLRVVRDLYLLFYMRVSKVADEALIEDRLKNLKEGYQKVIISDSQSE